MPPEIFIPIAEQTGLMPKLGQYIMNKSMYEITALQNKLATRFSLAINVSVKQFVQLNFFEVLMQSIEDFGDKSLPLTIEITESLFIESLDVLLPVFEKMKKHQISLALDDFGTGYSSLSMIRDAPIDELKIDKSFVDHITDNNVDKAMVKSIISMGKNLNMRVLAEGIETLEHAKILSKYGCDLFQGYYISKPLNIEELEAFVYTLHKRH
ncbi:EAL domain-containing protein [Psychromonas sp. KJ10-2]|uniref:EAL domain-containing protein n=1 Tax=Psychromonas sp. KJ10-2 TaxID=3391822 RepID=UPI0039B59817